MPGVSHSRRHHQGLATIGEAYRRGRVGELPVETLKIIRLDHVRRLSEQLSKALRYLDPSSKPDVFACSKIIFRIHPYLFPESCARF